MSNSDLDLRTGFDANSDLDLRSRSDVETRLEIRRKLRPGPEDWICRNRDSVLRSDFGTQIQTSAPQVWT